MSSTAGPPSEPLRDDGDAGVTPPESSRGVDQQDNSNIMELAHDAPPTPPAQSAVQEHGEEAAVFTAAPTSDDGARVCDTDAVDANSMQNQPPSELDVSPQEDAGAVVNVTLMEPIPGSVPLERVAAKTQRVNKKVKHCPPKLSQ